jgi:hypothetical protein
VPSALDPPPPNAAADDTSRSGPEAAGEWSPPPPAAKRPPMAARPPTASAINDPTDPKNAADKVPEVGSPLQAKTGAEEPQSEETVLDREIEMASSMAADAMLEKKKVFEEAMKATLRLRRGRT